MSDIFHEVDEEVRRERLKRLWDRYGIYVIVLVVLFVGGIAAWRGYDYWQNKKAAEAGSAFEAAAILSEQEKHADAEAAFAKVAEQAPSGYRALARLRAANEIALRDKPAAVKAYDDLAADSSLGSTLQDVAALRAALILIDTAPLAELRRRLDPLAAPNRAFRHTARELLALSAWRGGDLEAARRFIDMVATDGETPQGTRQRIELLSAMIAGGGKG